MFNIFLYAHFDYETKPLAMVELPYQLTPRQQVELLTYLNVECYGILETPKTPAWAPEYELWARALLCDNGIVINPKYILLTNDTINRICHILGEKTENAKVFSRCANNKSLQKLIAKEFRANPDSCVGVSIDDGLWPVLQIKKEKE